MALNLENINIARKSQGLEPLTELPKAVETPAGGAKTPEEIEAEKKNTELPKDETKVAPVVGELTDEQLIELLGKRGIKASSLDELKPKEAQKTAEELAEERDNQKLTYGIEKGLFNKKDYESFITDNNAKENLVYSQYHGEAKKEDPTLTDEEIETEFKEKFGLDSEPGSRKHKRGAKEINVIAAEILKAKHAKIFEAENKFSAYESEAKSEAEKRRTVASKTPDYVKNVNEVFSELGKISGKFNDQESYEVSMVNDSVEKAKKDFLTPDFVEQQILAGRTKEEIKTMARSVVVNQNLPFILSEHAKQVMAKHVAGTKGIVPGGEKKKVDEKDKPKLTANQQVIYDQYLQSQSATQN